MAKIEITKEQFNRYEGCRLSGVTNMFDLKNVTALTGLDKNQCLEIMNNYLKYKEKYQ